MDEQNLVEEAPIFEHDDLKRLEQEITPEMGEGLPQPVVEYIAALQETLNRTETQCARAQEQTEKAYESKRALDQQYMAYRTVTEQKLMFVQSAINNIHQAMRLIGGNH